MKLNKKQLLTYVNKKEDDILKLRVLELTKIPLSSIRLGNLNGRLHEIRAFKIEIIGGN